MLLHEMNVPKHEVLEECKWNDMDPFLWAYLDRKFKVIIDGEHEAFFYEFIYAFNYNFKAFPYHSYINVY